MKLSNDAVRVTVSLRLGCSICVAHAFISGRDGTKLIVIGQDLTELQLWCVTGLTSVYVVVCV